MLLFTHALLVWQSRSPAVETASNDDAEYLLLSRSLRSFNYQDQHILQSPTHAQYPPAYPAVLALSTSIFGEHLAVVQIVTLLCSVLALLLIFDIARRMISPIAGVLLLAPLAVNSHLIGYAGRIASEMPYMLFSFGALWTMVAFPRSDRTIFFAGVLAILAALTRSIGLALVLALPLFLLLQRRVKPALIFCGVTLFTVGAWFIWTMLAPNQFNDRSYTAVAASTSRNLPNLFDLLLLRASKFVSMYVTRSFPAGLELPASTATVIDNAIWIVLIVALGGLGLWAARKEFALLPLYVLMYMGLLLLYPFKLTRFFMPIAPLVLLAMYLGIVVLTRRWKPGVGGLLMALLAGAMIIHSVPRSLEKVKTLEHCDRSAALTSAECFRAETTAFLAATRYAKERLPKEAVVLTIKEAAFSYYTGLKVHHMFQAQRNSGEDPLEYLRARGIEYILISAYVGGSKYSPRLAPVCGKFEVLVRHEPRTALLKVHNTDDPLPVSRSLCPLMEEWSLLSSSTETS